MYDLHNNDCIWSDKAILIGEPCPSVPRSCDILIWDNTYIHISAFSYHTRIFIFHSLSCTREPFHASNPKLYLLEIMTTLCKHKKLILQTSSHAEVAGYEYHDARTRLAATTTRAVRDVPVSSVVNQPSTYPAPLVLPEDDLAWDPRCPPQSFRA